MPANIKELDKRIRSVRNTQQITRAMKMVAAAKLRRTQDRLLASRPYRQRLASLLRHLSSAATIDHPFLQEQKVQRRLVVVVSSDKGLCGSYNANLLRRAEKVLAEASADVEQEIYAVGRRAHDYFRRRGWTFRGAIDDFGGVIDMGRIHAVADELMRLYVEGTFQEIVAVSTRFISTLSNRPTVSRLLPFTPAEAQTQEASKRPGTARSQAATGRSGANVEAAGRGADRSAARASGGPSGRGYLYEPDPQTVLIRLLPKAVRDAVYGTLAEAFTSEHAARMTSMGSATDNAGDLIDSLVLFRNRARQAAITQEISEIVGGADALK